MTKLKTSNSFSLQGWDFKKWVAGNGEALKLVIGAGVAIAALYPESAYLVAAGGVGMIVIKGALDIIDFYMSEVEL